MANEPKPLTFPQVISFGLLACLLYGMTGGLRADIGILLQPLAAHTGLAYQDVSFCIAVMQLIFGCTQPVFGLLAARTSNRLVLLLGVLLMAGSLLGMIFAHSFAGLFLSLGIGFGIGAGALAFGLILTSAIYFAGRENAMMLAGMLNASAGLCGFFLSLCSSSCWPRAALPQPWKACCRLLPCCCPLLFLSLPGIPGTKLRRGKPHQLPLGPRCSGTEPFSCCWPAFLPAGSTW